jgi:hypothetical protein
MTAMPQSIGPMRARLSTFAAVSAAVDEMTDLRIKASEGLRPHNH